MARLNEITAPAESIDALKRRFVRQNRELARINSTQSVRIRNLESEITRLLSENITFREQNIKLQYEIDKYPTHGTWNDTGAIRSKLEAKLAELRDLVKDLGMAHSNLSVGQTSRRRSTQQSSPKRSPDQRNWKNALSLSEVTSVSDLSRLPPIFEDKYFPGRTLESEELLGMVDGTNASDSPELGPPPIATLDEGDPIKYDRIATSLEAQEELYNAGPMHFPCTANLETRKKRRESLHRPESCRSNTSDDLHFERARVEDITGLAPQPLKAGAKRKLNIREDEKISEAVEASEQEALKLDQKYGNIAIKECRKELRDDGSKVRADPDMSRHQAITQQNPPHQEKAKHNASSSAARARKALGPKSVNTNPSESPFRMKGSVLGDKIQDGQNNSDKKSRHREQSVAKSSSSKTVRPLKTACSAKVTGSNTQEVVMESDTQHLSPSDPQSHQSFGDGSTHPGLRGTPPLLISDVVNAASTTGRASRRPRGSVSYAEPNLRDKMRRPTKDFVDAVGADDRPQVIKVEEVKSIGSEAEQSCIRTIVVKREDPGEETGLAWKDLPLPIDEERQRQDTTASAEMTSPPSSESSSAKERTVSVANIRGFPDHENIIREEVKSSSSGGSTIAALAAGKHKSRKRKGDEPSEQNESEGLFELRTSSPIGGIKEIESQGAKRFTRRHSSAVNNQESTLSRSTTVRLASRRGDRRPERAITSATMGEEQANEGIELKDVKGGGELQKSAGETSLGTERSASRRRSMMI